MNSLPDALPAVLDLPHVQRVTVYGSAVDPLWEDFRDFEARLSQQRPGIVVYHMAR